MALNAYLRIKGQKQGDIKGSVLQKGRENSIAVRGYLHEIGYPLDVLSGLPAGKRLHRPFVITKELDKSSPLLLQALSTNELLPQWELKCYTAVSARGAAGGPDQHHFTIQLKNARVAALRSIMQNNLEPAGAAMPQLEEVTFAYESITWTWQDGGISSTDAWPATT